MAARARAAKPEPRAIALAILGEVLERRRPLDGVLESDRGLPQLEPRDRAFVRTMVATALRRLGQIDALLARFLERPLPAKAAVVRNLLRLGAAQLLFLKVPAHAAVGETVALAEGAGWGGFTGLANAVLRRLAAEGEEMLASQDAPRLTTPDWLWQSWSRSYGEAAAHAIAEAYLAEPPLDLSVKANARGWAQELGAEILPTGTLRLKTGGEITALPGFAEGAWWVQDAAAALPARLLGAAPDERVIDLCAAPGGKTAQLALTGAAVTALDRSAERLRRLAENLARLKLPATLIAADAGLWRPERPADAVLLDAPCTATGAMRRHPDIRHLKTPDDIARMTAEQDRLLAAAVAMLRPGGRLVYAVCSLEAEEGPGRITKLLSGGAPLRRRAIAADELPGLAALIDAAGDLRTLPSHLPEHGGLDGFYACRLERL